jgi:hypothetical protein
MITLATTARFGAALLASGIPVAASASFECDTCVFDPTEQDRIDYDYTVPSDGRTYRWTIMSTSSDPTATIRLAEPNQTEVLYDYRDGSFIYDGSPSYRFDQTVTPGLTTILVRAPRSFDLCDEPGSMTDPCRAVVHIWGNGTFLTVAGSAPITATFSESVVPEPASWTLMISGFGVAGAAMRYRRRRSATARFACDVGPAVCPR